MQPLDPCERFRRDHAADPRAASSADGAIAGDAHAAACPVCRAWVERRARAVQVVGTLTRISAPAALDRRVAEDVALAALPRRRAPEVLDRLVREELEAGNGAPVARSLVQLGRLAAPEALDQRVAETIAAARSASSDRQDGVLLRRDAWGRSHRPRRAPLLAAAAVLLVGVLGLSPLVAPGGSAPEDGPRPRLDLVMVDSPEALDPLAAGLLAGLRGAPLGALAPRIVDGDRIVDEDRGVDEDWGGGRVR